MTTTTSNNGSPSEELEKTRGLLAAHREVEALLKLGVISPQRAEQLKQVLTPELIEQHDQDGMTVSDMIDMYRDLIGP